MPLRPFTTAGFAVLVLSATTMLLPAVADAAAPPARPHGERVSAIGHHSITVTLPKIKNATGYRLYVSTRRADLAASRLTHARHSGSSSRPRLIVSRLPYGTSRYYWRVKVSGHGKTRLGERIGAVSLRPATPRSVRATSSSRGTWLTWNAPAGYQRTRIVQATNKAMTRSRKVATIGGTTAQFTPTAVTTGRSYWFRVQTINGATASAWSPAVHVVVRSRLQPISVMTYNVLTSRADGTVTTGERIAPWAQRRPVVDALIAGAAADVVCVQEGGGWSGTPEGYGGRRQVDDLASDLPGYTLARTETPPSEHHYYRTGNYVLYRTSAYRAVAAGGYWDIGDTRTAAYQLLQSRRSGARVLVVSAHLNFGAGRAFDDQRARETHTLLSLAGTMAAKAGVPVVYAGDFNSVLNRNHAYDAPGDVMRAAKIADAHLVAQAFGANPTYNSANLYLRTPPHNGQSIDYVYAPPGVAVASRRLLVNLSGGHFVGTIPSDHNPVLVTAAYPY